MKVCLVCAFVIMLRYSLCAQEIVSAEYPTVLKKLGKFEITIVLDKPAPGDLFRVNLVGVNEQGKREANLGASKTTQLKDETTLTLPVLFRQVKQAKVLFLTFQLRKEKKGKSYFQRRSELIHLTDIPYTGKMGSYKFESKKHGILPNSANKKKQPNTPQNTPASEPEPKKAPASEPDEEKVYDEDGNEIVF